MVNFNQAASAMRRHEALQSHALAVADQARFVSSTDQGVEDVRQQLVMFDAQRRAANRAKLRVIADTLRFCGRQNVAIRGHREPDRRLLDLTEPFSANPGNFWPS